MHRVDHPKAKTERDSKSLKRRINSVTEEDSYKEISRFVQRNPAYREEGLVTHSTLTQGKAAPGRDRRGHERKGSLQSHSSSWEGKGPSQTPSTSGNVSRGPRQGLGNLYTWGYTSTDLYKQRDKLFIGRTDVEAESPILRPPDVKS